jgi:uncharacterized membrane protein
MTYLILGLVVFLGTHSVRIVANNWRIVIRERLGVSFWRALYSMLSILGFFLLVWGFGVARQSPVQLWNPPVGMKHLASALTLLSFVLVASAYVPGNRIKARIHHPMAAAVTLWALAHLLANGNAAHVLLFGSFLIWSVLSFMTARRRDQFDGKQYLGGNTGSTGVAVALGVAAWVATALWLHGLLIGVRPFG